MIPYISSLFHWNDGERKAFPDGMNAFVKQLQNDPVDVYRQMVDNVKSDGENFPFPLQRAPR